MAVALARQRDVEGGIRSGPHARARLPLIFEVAEVVQLVLDDRTADGGAVLLNADGNDAVRDRIVGVEAAALEVAAKEPIQLVSARLGDRVHLHAGRAPLRRVELVGDELELRDRILAEARLVAGAKLRANLLSVEIELELARLAPVSVRQRRGRVGGRRAAAGREQRQRHPVAAVDRKLLDLTAVDVAAKARVLQVDEGSLTGDRHGFLDG